MFRLPQTVADSIHTARDATKRLCRVGSGGVNAVGEDGKTNISSERGAEPDHDEAAGVRGVGGRCSLIRRRRTGGLRARSGGRQSRQRGGGGSFSSVSVT